MMTQTQIGLFEKVETAVEEAHRALNNADFVGCVDWLTDAQLGTAQLVATLMSRIQTRP